MDWQSPQFLYLILPVCVGWFIIALYSESKRQKAREAFVAQPMWERVLPEASRFRFWLKLLLRELAIIAGLMALAGPQFGMQLEQVVPRGSDLYVLIDVSRSMLATDVPPSRLERAKADVSALANRLEGERIGLIAFAGQSVVKCPLTVDYDSFRRALNDLDPNSAPRGGTAIGDAIRKAIEVFDAKAERDQAVLLITDGDDQESYPLEAATVAAERKVTIFTVGLGDTETGSRVPQKGSTSTYLEYEGQQVWSKLDGKLLQEIAFKTSGVYIPAGTRAYDLGELYTAHLKGRRGDAEASQQRIRKSERFQIFLAMALILVLADLCVSPCLVPREKKNVAAGMPLTAQVQRPVQEKASVRAAKSALLPLLALSVACGSAAAGESQTKVREGLKLYQQEQYEAAGKEFAAAREELDKEKSEKAAVAAFDEACAWHRKGDIEKARDRYLKAGLSKDRSIATASHFNLGTMSAENARKLAGERPEDVPADKRQEILDELKQSIVSYRHCLELQPDHAQSRRNLELVRNWIKYYSDRWRDIDRQKLRDESNLIEFLEFLINTQKALHQTVTQLPENVPADSFAELKRSQDELQEEIPTLRQKIATELQPETPGAGGAAPQMPKEIQEGITLLQGWADKAGDKMINASLQLSRAEPQDAAVEQHSAIDELDRIWDAVIPFHPLLARELADQTEIARTLAPEPAAPEDNSDADTESPESDDSSESNKSYSLSPDTIEADQLEKLTRSQETTLRKARLLAPKAQAELDRAESQPAPETDSTPPGDGTSEQPPVDPEAIKAGLRKAVELAPKAVEAMEAAVDQLQKKDTTTAGTHAEEARRILEEIQQAQPENEQQDQDQQEKEDQKDQENDDQENDDQKQKKDGDKDKEQKDKKQDDKKDQDNRKQDQKEQQSDSKQNQQQASKDRIEDALRKVRERQQEKRERDREARARMPGRAPVDRDW